MYLKPNGVRKALRQVRATIHHLPSRDKTGVPDDLKTGFAYIFLDTQNRKRINKFARKQVDHVLSELLRPEQAEALEEELDGWITEATAQFIVLVDDEEDPSPQTRKTSSGGKKGATPKGGLLGKRKLQVEETPTRRGRHEAQTTGSEKVHFSDLCNFAG